MPGLPQAGVGALVPGVEQSGLEAPPSLPAPPSLAPGSLLALEPLPQAAPSPMANVKIIAEGRLYFMREG
jgi:hypothetical protein